MEEQQSLLSLKMNLSPQDFASTLKEKGDVLVVVLRESSILPLIDKVEILSAFEMVDYVVEFDN